MSTQTGRLQVVDAHLRDARSAKRFSPHPSTFATVKSFVSVRMSEPCGVPPDAYITAERVGYCTANGKLPRNAGRDAKLSVLWASRSCMREPAQREAERLPPFEGLRITRAQASRDLNSAVNAFKQGGLSCASSSTDAACRSSHETINRGAESCRRSDKSPAKVQARLPTLGHATRKRRERSATTLSPSRTR